MHQDNKSVICPHWSQMLNNLQEKQDSGLLELQDYRQEQQRRKIIWSWDKAICVLRCDPSSEGNSKANDDPVVWALLFCYLNNRLGGGSFQVLLKRIGDEVRVTIF